MTINRAQKWKVGRFSSTLDRSLANLGNTGRGRKQIFSIAADSCVAVFCLWFAYTLRHGQLFSDFKSTWHLFFAVPLLTVGIFGSLGVYRWVIRSTNQRLFKQLLKGCILSAFALVLVTFLFPPERANPRSLFVIYGLLSLCGTGGIRLAWQALFDKESRGEPIAIYGAGNGGQQLASMLRSGQNFQPLAFIDDDVRVQGSMLSGLPVFGGDQARLKKELNRLDVNRIVLAMPSISASEYQRLLGDLEQLGLPLQTMPSIEELLSGTARVDEIRDISISDILGRSEVAPDRSLMGLRVTGKTVLVTGGGGSIGSELCRQIMMLKPARLIVLDNSEANLYYITEDLNALSVKNAAHFQASFLPVLGSVLNEHRMKRLIHDESVDTVFHAAAYKHVPIVEAQPDQGANTNVFGTLTVLNAAIAQGASDFVLISTDKAVRPANAMGASKRVAEMVLQAKANQQSKLCISMVRFGNVLGSSGSVVPKFKTQIESGGPVTLTHSEVTRYFMTIPEAAQLVLQASALANGGDVFVLDMGEPVRIEELAISMIRLYGKKLKRETGREGDIDIVVEGLRPGEKMYEELFIDDSHKRTPVDKIFSASETWLPWSVLEPRLSVLRIAVLEQEASTVREILLALAFDYDNRGMSDDEENLVLQATMKKEFA